MNLSFRSFQNIIPISLYLSIEFVRTAQAAFIYFDHQIYYDKNDQPTLARSWNLSDDLGQIQYIFSDKTGTLTQVSHDATMAIVVTDFCTQNAMIFRECSVGGKLYKGDPPRDEMVIVEDNTHEMKISSSSDATSSTHPTTADPIAVEEQTRGSLPTPEVKLSASVLAHFRNAALAADIGRSAEPDADAALSRSLNGFFACLALCHTVIAYMNPLTNVLEYKAQSPDEAALVQAAADVGFVFCGQDRGVLRMKTPFSDQVEEYELLNVLDFTSARKRMSVVVRKLDQNDRRLFLLTKGADNVVFERLRVDENEELKATTERHLDEFANEG